MTAGKKRYTLKSDTEIIADFKKDMAEDMKTIKGSKEQADFLERINRAETEGVKAGYREGK